MKKILRGLLALTMAVVCFLTPQKINAGSYYTITIKDMSDHQITAFQVYQGDSLIKTFKQYPECLQTPPGSRADRQSGGNQRQRRHCTD